MRKKKQAEEIKTRKIVRFIIYKTSGKTLTLDLTTIEEKIPKQNLKGFYNFTIKRTKYTPGKKKAYKNQTKSYLTKFTSVEAFVKEVFNGKTITCIYHFRELPKTYLLSSVNRRPKDLTAYIQVNLDFSFNYENNDNIFINQ